jgi:hypothetical protein
MTKAERLRLWVATAAIRLLSGAVMMLAGYIGHTESWTTAGFITIPGGILILVARALARTADPPAGQTVAPGGHHPAERVAAKALTLLSGGVMVLAGYAGPAWGWGLALPLAAVGGVLIGVAFALDRRSVKGTTTGS